MESGLELSRRAMKMLFNASEADDGNQEVLGSFLTPAMRDNVTEDVFKSRLSPPADIAVGIFLVLADIVAITLNVLVLVVTFQRRRILVLADYFVAYLALSDLGHPVVGYPLVIVSSFNHRWTFGHAGCVLYGFVGFIFGVNSMCTLGAMSIYRYLSICKVGAGNRVTLKHVKWSLSVCLAFATFWSVLPLFGVGAYGLEPYNLSCSLAWSKSQQAFVTASCVGCLGLPVIVMVFTYGRIFLSSREASQRLLQWKGKPGPGWRQQDIHLLRMTVLICFSFVMAWSPYSAMYLYKVYSPEDNLPVSLTVLPAVFAKLSHTLNPVLYFLLNRKFREHICEMSCFCVSLRRGSTSVSTHSVTMQRVKLDDQSNNTDTDDIRMGRCRSMEQTDDSPIREEDESSGKRRSSVSTTYTRLGVEDTANSEVAASPRPGTSNGTHHPRVYATNSDKNPPLNGKVEKSCVFANKSLPPEDIPRPNVAAPIQRSIKLAPRVARRSFRVGKRQIWFFKSRSCEDISQTNSESDLPEDESYHYYTRTSAVSYLLGNGNIYMPVSLLGESSPIERDREIADYGTVTKEVIMDDNKNEKLPMSSVTDNGACCDYMDDYL